MTNIFIVVHYYHSGGHTVEGAFSTFEKADKACIHNHECVMPYVLDKRAPPEPMTAPEEDCCYPRTEKPSKAFLKKWCGK